MSVAAASVGKLVTKKNAVAWSTGSIEDWAGESFSQAKSTVYNFDGQKTFVDDHGGTGEVLDAVYEARALQGQPGRSDRIDIDPIAGLGIVFRPTTTLTLRPALGWSYDERRVSDDPHLAGLQPVKSTPFVALTARSSEGAWTAQLQVTERLGPRTARGGLAEASLQHGWLVGAGAAISLGGGVTLMDASYARTFYAIRPTEAAASGLPGYQAGADIRDLGGFAHAALPLDDHWILLFRAGLRRMQGTALSSPVVGRPWSGSVVASVMRAI